jgi:sec-independent protein translocase protein TatA
MGLDNPLHILILLAIVLLVFGARRLPEIGRSLGTGLREFKRSVTGEDEKPALTAATPQAQPQQAPTQQTQPQPAPAQQAPTQPAPAQQAPTPPAS